MKYSIKLDDQYQNPKMNNKDHHLTILGFSASLTQLKPDPIPNIILTILDFFAASLEPESKGRFQSLIELVEQEEVNNILILSLADFWPLFLITLISKFDIYQFDI